MHYAMFDAFDSRSGFRTFVLLVLCRAEEERSTYLQYPPRKVTLVSDAANALSSIVEGSWVQTLIRC